MNARFGFALAIICASLLAACGGGGGGGSSPLPGVTPTYTPTGQPSATPSAQPTTTPANGTSPTPQPTGTPTAHPTSTPTGQPTGSPHPTGTPSAQPTSTPTPAATATPTSAPALVTATVGAQATTVPIPSGAGFGGTVSVPAGSGTLAITDSRYTPGGVNNGIVSPNGPLGYFTMTAQGGSVTLHGVPGFTVQLPPGGYPAGPYFVAFYDTSGVASVWESSTTTGSMAGSNQTVTLPATTATTITIPANGSIYVAVYYGQYIPPQNVAGCVGGNDPRPMTKTRSLVGVHPITSGNTFAYSGTLNETIVRSSPCPMPTATSNAQVTVNVNETAPPTSAPSGTQIDEHSVESNAFTTYTQQVTTDSYVASNAGSFFELGETAVDQGGNTVVTTYGSQGLQFGKSPEANGNQWSNLAPSTVLSTLADGTTYNRTYATNGTYSEIDSLPGGFVSNIAENADGSGQYLVGTLNQYGAPVQYPITVSAPNGGTVTMTYNSTAHTVPLWYPVPFTPYSDNTQDLGQQSIPSVCGTLPSGYTGPAEKIVRTTTTTDAVLGYIDTRTTTTWDQNAGPVCVQIRDVENFYYDYMFDTNWVIYRTNDGNPIQTNTITETYGLSGAPTANIVRQTASVARAFRAQVAAGQAGITFARGLERAHRLKAFAHALHQARLGGRR